MNARKTWQHYAPFVYTFAFAIMLLWALYRWRNALLPFMVGLLLAYLLMPIVKWIERWRR